ncbi:MAG: cysteine-rich CWC family protein [Ferruginibacter sp.]|nr:cysteine-rich CWC family protein [Chitinophagaceae bacterium]
MCKHEEKLCPRCSVAFECKAGSIMQCQCSGIQLTVEESAFIQAKYEDCLCINCLFELQHKVPRVKEK